MPTWIAVVAAALEGPAGLLLQRVIAGKRHAGLWEFPGGKVEPAEAPRAALSRELDEELALEVAPEAWQPAGFAEETGPVPIVLFLYTARVALARPQGRDGQAWGWFAPDAAARLPLAPLDRALLRAWARERGHGPLPSVPLPRIGLPPTRP